MDHPHALGVSARDNRMTTITPSSTCGSHAASRPHESTPAVDLPLLEQPGVSRHVQFHRHAHRRRRLQLLRLRVASRRAQPRGAIVVMQEIFGVNSPHPRRRRRLCGGRLPRDRAGDVRPRRAQRRSRLHAGRHAAGVAPEGRGRGAAGAGRAAGHPGRGRLRGARPARSASSATAGAACWSGARPRRCAACPRRWPTTAAA